MITRSQNKKYQTTEDPASVIVEGDSLEQPATQNGLGEDTRKKAYSRYIFCLGNDICF